MYQEGYIWCPGKNRQGCKERNVRIFIISEIQGITCSQETICKNKKLRSTCRPSWNKDRINVKFYI